MGELVKLLKYGIVVEKRATTTGLRR